MFNQNNGLTSVHCQTFFWNFNKIDMDSLKKYTDMKKTFMQNYRHRSCYRDPEGIA